MQSASCVTAVRDSPDGTVYTTGVGTSMRGGLHKQVTQYTDSQSGTSVATWQATRRVSPPQRWWLLVCFRSSSGVALMIYIVVGCESLTVQKAETALLYMSLLKTTTTKQYCFLKQIQGKHLLWRHTLGCAQWSFGGLVLMFELS